MKKSSKTLLSKNIPVIFDQEFPAGYLNDVRWWGNISREELHTCLPDGTAKLLTLDLDFGDACSLHCPHCFRRDARFDKINSTCKPLTQKEIIEYVREAKGLGLRQIKILGRGEPFENPNFLGFLREMTKMDIGVAIFTKGHVLGSDELSKKYNKRYGINSSMELIEELYKLKVSILLGFNSFDKEIQESFVGMKVSSIKNYIELRDRALMLLTKAGFNKYEAGKATRLAMIAAPIKPENIDEIYDLFVWARIRNIYMLSCPTTVSGKGIDEQRRVETEYAEYIDKLEKLYVKIYKWSVSRILISVKVLAEDGVSLYPGCHICNQTAAGFYLNLSGQVNQCPGRCDESTIFSRDIRKEKSLKDVWLSCANYRRAMNGKLYNCHCAARDGHSLPANFYKKVEAEII